MAITNLTNTTWVFKDGPLDFSCFDKSATAHPIPLDFVSNSSTYHFLVYIYQSVSTSHSIRYAFVPTQGSTVYNQDDSTGVFSWSNSVYQTIQIIGGSGVSISVLIDFLSKNAICQTPLVTVTFNMNGIGAAVSSQTFAKGGKADMIIPSDDGYIFAGWYTDSSLTTRFNFNMSILSNTTIYAKWIPKAIKTKVSGAWNSGTPLVKVNNTWKDVDKAFVKVNGVWQPVISNVPPSPTISTFKVGNITYTFEEGMTWSDWILLSKYPSSTSGMNIPSSPGAEFHGELYYELDFKLTDNSEFYESGSGYVSIVYGNNRDETAFWDLLIYSNSGFVRAWDLIIANKEYTLRWN